MMGLERPSWTTALKWLGFVTAVWVQAISGNNYTFSNYSDSLKTLMNLTQVQLNYLSVAKDVGKAFGLLAGLASDRFPTWVLLLVGSLEGLIGYGAQWLVVSETVSPLPYWTMCIFLCMGGNSTTWMNTAILVTCIRNFRRNRGPVAGILKGYVGLSTAIFTDLCTALFSDNPADFLLMLSIAPFVVCLTAMLFLRELGASATSLEDKQESSYFNTFNTLAVVVAVYLLAFDFVGSKGHAFDVVFSAILLVLLASPLIIPAYIALRTWFESRAVSDIEDQISDPFLEQDLVPDELVKQEVVKPSAEEVAAVNEVVKEQPALGEDHSIFQAFKALDFWLLFVSFLCAVGPGMMVMNNMGQMGSALGYSDVSIFVSLLSIMGFFGRIISGTASEYCINFWNNCEAVPRGARGLLCWSHSRVACPRTPWNKWTRTTSRHYIREVSEDEDEDSYYVRAMMKWGPQLVDEDSTFVGLHQPFLQTALIGRCRGSSFFRWQDCHLTRRCAPVMTVLRHFPAGRKAATPRPLFNAASQILLAIGFVVMGIAVPGCLYIGSILVGICYGVRLAITVPTASELFGLKNYGLVYNILILNLPLGSFLFSGLLAGYLYDAQATATSSGGNECYGAHCYRLCFFILAATCIIGSGLDTLLAQRTKNLYRKISGDKRLKSGK